MLSKRTLALIILFIIANLIGHGQNTTAIDVQSYKYALTLADDTDTIRGMAAIHVKFIRNTTSVLLDLGSINGSGKGMQVSSVTVNDKSISFSHSKNKLTMQLPAAVKAGSNAIIKVHYKGIPADGLIIGKSIYNKRTFFGDNWPNRAHNWIPCNDIPSDKAALEFIITAPSHYSIISNGIKIEERSLNDSTKITHWKEDVPLPTKVMVIGAADFTVSNAGYAGTIPVTSWVYEEEKDKGFYDYAKAKDILQYFVNYIGPYGYKKLANVQSKTIFGGMENAGAIFYYEGSVTGKGSLEDLLAHEIAHQWFGDMVTETNFKHLWLSEGFATYLTNIYLESKYGTDSMQRRLIGERNDVIRFAATSKAAVVDTISDHMQLLNANSYQKGGWILHMLRNKVGDAVFKNIIQEHYKRFAGKNASSEDFIATAESVSHKNLKPFFYQWLHLPGMPVIGSSWKYNAAKKNIVVTLEQKQERLFNFPLDIAIVTDKGKMLKTVTLKKAKAVFIFPVKENVTEVILDPDCKLLWEPFLK